MSYIVKLLHRISPEFAKQVVQYIHEDEYFFAYEWNLKRILRQEHPSWVDLNVQELGSDGLLDKMGDSPHGFSSGISAHQEALDQIYEAHLRL